MTSIAELTARITAFRDAREWRQFHTPKDMALSLVLEAAELAEHFQWKNEAEVSEYLEKGGREAVGAELSDVLYWVLLIAHDLSIDVAKAFEQKMAVNEEKYPVDLARGRHLKYDKL